jgi:4-amino-4-deoxy-L-arabinose transferase-like glycosyltransferase
MNKSAKALISILLFGALLRLLYLYNVPGLHHDEARIGIGVHEILGEHVLVPRVGSDHSGFLPFYFTLPFFWLFGETVFALRLPVVLFGLLTILYGYLLVSRLFDKTTGLVAALFFAVFPWAVISSRIADGVQTTLPFFLMAGLFYYFAARPRWRNRFLSGLILGLGVSNHPVFIVVPTAVGLYVVCREKFQALRERNERILLTALLVGLIPGALLTLVTLKMFASQPSWALPVYAVVNTHLLLDLVKSIPYFLRMIDGDLFFLRTAGYPLLFVLPINAFIFLCSVAYVFLAKRENADWVRPYRMFAIILAMTYVLIVHFVKSFGLSYFLVPLCLATLMAAAYIGKHIKGRRLVVGLLAVVVFVNTFYIGVNYFWNFRRTRGQTCFFWLGGFYENSHHFVDTSKIYRRLAKMDVCRVYAPDHFISMPLSFYNLAEQKLVIQNRLDSTWEEFWMVMYRTQWMDPTLDKRYFIAERYKKLQNFHVLLLRTCSHN